MDHTGHYEVNPVKDRYEYKAGGSFMIFNVGGNAGDISSRPYILFGTGVFCVLNHYEGGK